MTAWMRGGVAAMLGVAFVLALSIPGLDGQSMLVVSNGGQLAAAVAATAACALAARRTSGHERLTWVLLGSATGGWMFGQTVWSYYEVVLGVEVPFPSLADVGFLVFPLLAAPALLFWRRVSDRASTQGRDLLDGAIVAASLLTLSWSTTLGKVAVGGGDGWLPLTLSLAYPIGDVVVATVVFSILGRDGAGRRATLLLVAGGVGGLAVADSAYVYLVATGSYSSGDLITSGWVFGFLLIAAGATTVDRRTGHVAQDGSTGATLKPDEHPAVGPTRLRLVLPYLPLLAASAAICHDLATSASMPLFDLILGVVLVVLVLARQFVAMHENYRLLRELQVARDQLQHQALHDPLTGLANRALFADRLDHALAQRRVSVSLLYCDLDDFKRINDELGHHAGDGLLRVVAERLVECVRPGDTVARLGGDEFAVLLEDPTGVRQTAQQVAERIVTAVQEPCQLMERDGPEGAADRWVRTTVSVGVAHHHGTLESTARSHLRVMPHSSATTAEQLLRQADSAMYIAKAAGKGQVVQSEAIGQDLVIGH